MYVLIQSSREVLQSPFQEFPGFFKGCIKICEAFVGIEVLFILREDGTNCSRRGAGGVGSGGPDQEEQEEEEEK